MSESFVPGDRIRVIGIPPAADRLPAEVRDVFAAIVGQTLRVDEVNASTGCVAYTRTGVDGVLLLQVCNAVAWGGLLALSFCIRRPAMLLIPCVLGFGYLAWAHASLDLAADAQSGIALVLIPIYALLPIGIGGLVGYVLDRRFAGHRAAE